MFSLWNVHVSDCRLHLGQNNGLGLSRDELEGLLVLLLWRRLSQVKLLIYYSTYHLISYRLEYIV